ncbi:MAG: ATP-binding protein [Pirellulaceae bacterium]|nr:ATP-binding protein [Pirellulaceae bacterium]
MIDFTKLDSNGLLQLLPPDEDDRWEFKSAEILKNKGELKAELGKQVSAFADSGGGYIAFGISDSRLVEPCDQQVGRQSMSDYLSVLVEQSVEYPIRDFRIHRVPVAADTTQSVYVLEIKDSPAAPHQAKIEKTYYYRIDGHSKPAPHFHLELLRNRHTKSVLEINRIEYSIRPCLVPLVPRQARVPCPTRSLVLRKAADARQRVPPHGLR